MANILVFDSGVGGLSIAAAIVERLPEHHLLFASDNAAYPYGTKPESELIPRVIKVTEKLIAETQADILVVACNTASTVVLPALRERLSIDVVGVVPAIKPAAKLSTTKYIGLLATPATIKREYTQELIDTFANDCNVDMIGSSELVDLAEQKLRQGNVSLKAIEKVIKPWLNQDNPIDIIVLACTHFPLLKDELNQLFQIHNKAMQWVDSAEGIAKRVESLLEKGASSQKKNNNTAIFTAAFEPTEFFENALQQLGIETMITIEV